MWNNTTFRPKRPCLNGQDCHYLRQHRCHFYHPREHYARREGTNIERLTNSISHIFRKKIEQEKKKNEIQQILKIIMEQRSQREARNQQARRQVIERQSQMIRPMQSYGNIGGQKTQKQLKTDIKWFFNHNNEFLIAKNMEQREKYDQCSICFSDYQDKDRILQLYCHHHYHKDCIKQWFIVNTQCPLCKKDFRLHEEYAQFDQNYKGRISKNQSIINAPVQNFNLRPVPVAPVRNTLFNFHNYFEPRNIYVDDDFDDDFGNEYDEDYENDYCGSDGDF